MSITLTNGQKEAIGLIEKWYRDQNKQVFELTGAGGTGKSTVVKSIIENLGLELSNVRFVTYTGKASLVLTMKGTPATTIHKLIYRVEEVVKSTVDPKTNETKYTLDLQFTKVESLEDDVKLIVADECSMISESIWADLKSYHKPIIVLGDLNQLPPINGNSPLLKDPDYELTEIMRQAEGDPIIHLSNLARNGKKINYGKYGDKCFVIPRHKVQDLYLTKSDIVLCCTNKTRSNLNKHIRELHGRSGNFPSKGDKLICRKNNWNLMLLNYPLINGMIGYVEDDIDKETYKMSDNSFIMSFRPDFLNGENEYFNYVKTDMRPFENVGMDLKNIMKERYNDSNIFEYGYAITTHLSQGSSWDKVIFYADLFGDSTLRKQLLYTGISRAESQLILVI